MFKNRVTAKRAMVEKRRDADIKQSAYTVFKMAVFDSVGQAAKQRVLILRHGAEEFQTKKATTIAEEIPKQIKLTVMAKNKHV